MGKEEILTLEEVSRYLKLSKDTVYKMAKRKGVPCFKIGRFWRFKKERIDKWLLKQEGLSNKKRKPKRRKKI